MRHMGLRKTDIRRLVASLGIEGIAYPWRIKPDPELALCITLRRLCFPSRWCESCEIFSRSEAFLSTCFLTVCEGSYIKVPRTDSMAPTTPAVPRASWLRPKAERVYGWICFGGLSTGISPGLLDQRKLGGGTTLAITKSMG